MWGVHPEEIDWNIALCTQIYFWESLSEVRLKKQFHSLKSYKIGLIYCSVLGIQLHIFLPKLKSEYAAQYFSLLPLDKHPQMLMFEVLY